MSAHVYSPGWGTDVELGSGQEHALGILRDVAAENPRFIWHDAPPLRAFDRSPSTAHRVVHRLAALGVIAIEVRRGCQGGIRFTFRVRRWKWTAPVRRALTLARMKVRELVRKILEPAQLALAHIEPPGRPYLVPERPGVAPTLWEECVLCGGREQVRMGLIKRTIDGKEQIDHGLHCIDHPACDARRART